MRSSTAEPVRIAAPSLAVSGSLDTRQANVPQGAGCVLDGIQAGVRLGARSTLSGGRRPITKPDMAAAYMIQAPRRTR